MTAPFEGYAGVSAFARSAEAGSFSAAARLAGATPSALSKSVDRLEGRLGVKLFLRSTRALTLTDEGAAYFERVAPLLGALRDAEDVLRAPEAARGALRVSMPEELGALLMGPLTSDFLTRHPEIRLDVSLTDRHVDLVREGFDLALRAGHAGAADWIARPVGALPLVLVASPAYLLRAGAPRSIDELKRAAHLRYMLAGRPIPIAFSRGELALAEGALDADSGRALRVAALNGLGIAQLLRATVEDDIRAGRLVVVLPDEPLTPAPLQILHAFGRLPPLRVRLFSDFIKARIAKSTRGAST